jgi:hypothetical protein
MALSKEINSVTYQAQLVLGLQTLLPKPNKTLVPGLQTSLTISGETAYTLTFFVHLCVT